MTYREVKEKFNEKKYPKWELLKYLIWQIILTFSNKPSLFSSKRIERSIVFNLVLILECCFIWYNRAKLTPMEFMLLIGPLLIYAGFNTQKIFKDIKENPNHIIGNDIPSSNEDGNVDNSNEPKQINS